MPSKKRPQVTDKAEARFKVPEGQGDELVGKKDAEYTALGFVRFSHSVKTASGIESHVLIYHKYDATQVDPRVRDLLEKSRQQISPINLPKFTREAPKKDETVE